MQQTLSPALSRVARSQTLQLPWMLGPCNMQVCKQTMVSRCNECRAHAMRRACFASQSARCSQVGDVGVGSGLQCTAHRRGPAR